MTIQGPSYVKRKVSGGIFGNFVYFAFTLVYLDNIMLHLPSQYK